MRQKGTGWDGGLVWNLNIGQIWKWPFHWHLFTCFASPVFARFLFQSCLLADFDVYVQFDVTVFLCLLLPCFTLSVRLFGVSLCLLLSCPFPYIVVFNSLCILCHIFSPFSFCHLLLDCTETQSTGKENNET